MEPIVSLERVTYSYGEAVPALRELSVSVYPGERIAVLGNNGAGKSTFFLCCNGVLRPQSGTIRLMGEPVGSNRQGLARLRRAVGLVFQDPDTQLLGGTVEEEISFGPMNLGLPTDEVTERVENALDSFALGDLRKRAPQYLSGGEKKRVTLADVLAMHPQMMLLDEPAASLDPANVRLLEQNLALLSGKGLALMIATHDVDFAWRWAQRVLVFHDGALAADDTPEKVFCDNALLQEAGLEQPMLVRIGLMMGLSRLPHTIEELQEEINT